FVGDDITDEDGFTTVNELGGYSILVDEGRESAARYRLADVGAVLDWITALPTVIADGDAEGRA
ncbi:MAG: trehalose-phosphatase, partial [Kiloniellaceae bacterium]